MSTLLESNKIRRVLNDLRKCLITELEDPANGVPRPCVVTVAPGDVVTPEYEGDCSDSSDPDQETTCGLAWVRLANAYPAGVVGAQDTTVGNCNTSIGFDINMGITRCYDPGEAREGPSEDDLTDVANLAIADMLIMKKAIRCCGALTSKEYILHAYAPIGPVGERVGGSWTISVSL